MLSLKGKKPSDAITAPVVSKLALAAFRLAILAEKEGNFPDAKKSLSSSLRNNPDYTPAYIELAKILKKEGKIEDSKEIYYKLIELYPKFQEPYYRLANLYREKGRLILFKKYMKKCYDLNPTSKWGIKAKAALEETDAGE